MGQWQGNYRSDFFQFTVGDYRPYAEEKWEKWEKSLSSARNVVKKLGPNGGFRSLSYEYTAEGGYTVSASAVLAAESAKIEAFFEKQGIPVTVQREEKQKTNRRPW
jgi:hypothetical protein